MDLLARIFDWLREQEAGFSALAAILVIAGVVFAGFRWLVSRRAQLAPESTPEPAPAEDPLLALPTGPVIAVLPFENLSEDPKQEYFSDGLTDDIITALSRFKNLFVIARNSTFRYKGQAVDVRQLSSELGARYVLEGSVQRAGDALRVTAQLLDAKDGTHLWAETYDRALSASSIFAVQDEITEQVVGTIASSLGVISRARFAEIREKPTDRLESYECVLQAEAYYRDNMVPSEHARVRDALEHAVQADPGYADAWAYLCFVYLDEHRFNFNPQPGPVDRALEAARRAVAADPTNQLAHCMLAHAHFYRKDLGAFEAETERALALNPNDATVLAALGHMLLYAGEEKGITFLRKAVVLDPFHPAWFHLPIALYHFDRREYEEALAAAKKIAIPGFYWAQVYLAAIYAESDRQREARSAFEELIRLFPGFTTATLSEELRKHNVSEERIGRWASALRKAGLPD